MVDITSLPSFLMGHGEVSGGADFFQVVWVTMADNGPTGSTAEHRQLWLNTTVDYYLK